jgi:hypothetical protein
MTMSILDFGVSATLRLGGKIQAKYKDPSAQEH